MEYNFGSCPRVYTNTADVIVWLLAQCLRSVNLFELNFNYVICLEYTFHELKEYIMTKRLKSELFPSLPSCHPPS